MSTFNTSLRTSPRRARVCGGGVLTLVLALGMGCEKQETTDPSAAAEAVEAGFADGPVPAAPAPGPTASPAATQAPTTAKVEAKPTDHIPRDRDPEIERKKMSLSRERSAKARKAMDQGRLDQAIREARQALKVHEQNVDAMLVIAESFYKQRKYEIVQSVTNSILQVDPDRLTPEEASQAHNLRGFAFLALGQDTAALQAFRKAADGDAKNASAWNNVGVQYLVQGDAQTAASCFKYATDLDPAFAQAHLNHGSALRATGQLVAAERAFKRALQLKPDDAAAHFNLGVLYLDADPFPEIDTVTRLNRAISELTRYKQRAMGKSATGPNGEAAKAMPGAGRDPKQFGNELVTISQADLYIEAAHKGIDREQRRSERDKRNKVRAAKDAAKAAEDAAARAKAAAEAATKPQGSAPQEPRPQGPAPQAPAPKAPAPQAPAPKAPAPQAPAPKAPAPQAPAPQAPAPQAPAPQAPAPQGPKPQAPAPQGPKAQSPAPQAPAPQRPSVQRPGA